jgi:hypothetical protein
LTELLIFIKGSPSSRGKYLFLFIGSFDERWACHRLPVGGEGGGKAAGTGSLADSELFFTPGIFIYT